MSLKHPIKTIKPPFKVKINNSQLENLSMHLKTKSLAKVLNFFALNMKFAGPFEAAKSVKYALSFKNC